MVGYVKKGVDNGLFERRGTRESKIWKEGHIEGDLTDKITKKVRQHAAYI